MPQQLLDLGLRLRAAGLQGIDAELYEAARVDGATLRLDVEDDGPGIPEENLETIFRRFYTSRPVSHGFGKNSGLGLSISRQIVEELTPDYRERVLDEPMLDLDYDGDVFRLGRVFWGEEALKAAGGIEKARSIELRIAEEDFTGKQMMAILCDQYGNEKALLLKKGDFAKKGGDAK